MERGETWRMAMSRETLEESGFEIREQEWEYVEHSEVKVRVFEGGRREL